MGKEIKVEEVFITTISLDEVYKGTDREAALSIFFLKLKELSDAGNLTYQCLETTCWIKSNCEAFPRFFFDLRDEAVDSGLLKKLGITE